MLAIAKIYTQGAAQSGKHYNSATHTVRIITNEQYVFDVKLADTGIRLYPNPVLHTVLWLHGNTTLPVDQSLSEQQIETLPVGADSYAIGVGLLLNLDQQKIPDIVSSENSSIHVGSGLTNDITNMKWILGKVEKGKVITGIGISEDGSTIILRSIGGEVVLGTDGALIGGKKLVLVSDETSTSAIVSHNPLHSLLPPTFFIPLPETLPNLQTIQKLATTAKAVAELFTL